MRVVQMTNDKGKAIANQMIVMIDGKRYFQSYNAVICEIDDDGNVYLDPKFWDYSRTTSKYLNKFLGLDSGQVRDYLDQGLYQFKNLN